MNFLHTVYASAPDPMLLLSGLEHTQNGTSQISSPPPSNLLWMHPSQPQCSRLLWIWRGNAVAFHWQWKCSVSSTTYWGKLCLNIIRICYNDYFYLDITLIFAHGRARSAFMAKAWSGGIWTGRFVSRSSSSLSFLLSAWSSDLIWTETSPPLT